MAIDGVQIANQALSELEEDVIQSFQDGTSIANLCARQFPDARDSALELHPWNFAKYYARLARSADTPQTDQWLYQYPLTSTDPYCIKVRSLNNQNNLRFEVGQSSQNVRVLFTNEGTAAIEYTGRQEDLDSWSPLARQVLVKILASRMAKAITGQSSVEQLKWEEGLALLQEARGSDGREGSPVRLQASNILTRARHRSGGSLWGLGIREGTSDI